MSSRTAEELAAELDTSLAWRKRELIYMRFAVESTTHENRPILVRAAIAILYAHWEGFVKEAGGRYMDYVARRRIPYPELAENFAAIGLRSEAAQLVRAATPSQCIQAYREFVGRQSGMSAISANNIIDTGSNLNYRRFENILVLLGLDSNVYQTREALIDERLLKTRNNIAHGDYVHPDFELYREVQDIVLEMLSSIKDQIIDAVDSSAYRRRGPS